ncbi:MAG: hypothetical protein EAX89_10680 [Candidatus Lokiarchaeota archaeon]|nr:hypothetical protein [Candidatus Lokiarchaeota archaeon]
MIHYPFNSKRNKNIFLVVFAIFLLLYSYISKFLNPFEILDPFVNANYKNLQQAIFSIILLFLIFSVILYFCMDEPSNNFFILTFMCGVIIVISPSLFTTRLFSSDSAIHLFIIKKIILNSSIPEYVQYMNFTYHRLIALVTSLTKSDPYYIILYLPQLVTFSLYYTGIYLILFRSKTLNTKYRKNLLTFLIFNPFILFNFSYFAPFSLLISVSPLLFYLTSHEGNLTWKKETLFTAAIMLLTITSHIFGYFIIGLGLFLIFLMIILGRMDHLTYKKILVAIYMTIALAITFILTWNQVMEILLPILPFSSTIKLYFTLYSLEGGELINFFRYNTIYALLFRLIQLFPIVFSFIYNQIYYFIKIRSKSKLELNYLTYLRICSDLLFSIFLISLFIGYNLRFFRMVVIIYFIYVMLSIIDLFLIIERLFSLNAENYKFNTKTKWISFTLLALILAITTSLTFETQSPYSSSVYTTLKWTNENLPNNSKFLTSSHLLKLIYGLTSYSGTDKYWALFGNEIVTPSFESVSYFLNDWIGLDFNVYLLLSFNDSSDEPISNNVEKLYSIAENSDFFEHMFSDSGVYLYKIILNEQENFL